MKVLTLIQPWATLIAQGEKKIETRSWKTSYRGPLLIHAGKKIDKQICWNEPFRNVLFSHDIVPRKSLIDDKTVHINLITGAIIAKCNLVDCQKIIEDGGSYAITDGHLMIKGNEYEFGDYTPKRYAWILQDVEILKEPIPAKGQLSLWEYDLGGSK